MRYSEFLESRLPELKDIERFIHMDCIGKIETILTVHLPNIPKFKNMLVRELPIHKITYGSTDPESPVLVLVGGVHGLERIGTQVVKALLFSFNELTKWDAQVRETLEKIKIVFIPLINPWGMALNSRANANGVDLMRNAPIEAVGQTKLLLSGHRLGPKLPWFRGHSESPMELEAQTLIEEITKDISNSKAAITLDVHSGFGFRDQLWFPYAKTIEPFSHLANVMAIKETLDKTYPYHVYKVEPQAINYVTHGDLWDHIYDEHCKKSQATYIPLCLEMGSWTWVRKNPSQVFLPGGIFDPILPHRRHRAYRRHHLIFDLLLRLMSNLEKWSTLDPQNKDRLEQKAMELWYK